MIVLFYKANIIKIPEISTINRELFNKNFGVYFTKWGIDCACFVAWELQSPL